MKQESRPTNLVEQHLKSVEGMQEATTDHFFYTRLRARMERQGGQFGFFKPGWAIAILVVLLVVNSLLLAQKQRPDQTDNATLQGFASAYDLTIQSSY